ncbi:MAG: 2Fe-2S iron-sulfur cluster-binding protein [Actinomycetota bacterium]
MLVNGVEVEPPEGATTLLDALRALGWTSVKDGCAPQGQCGCCTVLVDGAPRVACVTPVRRVIGRSVTTVEGLSPEQRERWVEAFLATGASQCGFCTPGILVRLAGLEDKDPGRLSDRDAVDRSLAAHLCRCTGWQTIVEAAALVGSGDVPAAGSERDLDAATQRATLELGAPQRVGPDVVLGRAGFASDTAPPDAAVAVIDADGEWAVAADTPSARQVSATVPGRRTTVAAAPPLELPTGDWAAQLRTSWVDAAYLETDCSWCTPGAGPAPVAANGGAFGGKRTSPLPDVAAELARRTDRAVLARWSREDCIRRGAKRPPVAGGARPDGTGVLRVVRSEGVAEAVAAVAPGLVVTEVDVDGPPTSPFLRAAGWAEALMLLAAAGASSEALEVSDDSVTVTQPRGGTATVALDGTSVRVEVVAGDPLDEVVLRSYCIGAVHMALGWVRSESIAVDADGVAHDLTVRSLGVLRAADMPAVEVAVADATGAPMAVSAAVFVATAIAEWRRSGYPTDLPVGRPGGADEPPSVSV